MSVIYHRLCNKSSTTDGTSGALTAYLFGLSQSPPVFAGFVFLIFFFLCRVLMVIVLSVMFLNTPLVSSFFYFVVYFD